VIYGTMAVVTAPGVAIAAVIVEVVVVLTAMRDR
jgi:hypothetical protein